MPDAIVYDEASSVDAEDGAILHAGRDGQQVILEDLDLPARSDPGIVGRTVPLVFTFTQRSMEIRSPANVQRTESRKAVSG